MAIDFIDQRNSVYPGTATFWGLLLAAGGQRLLLVNWNQGAHQSTQAGRAVPLS
jgi:hypothetical protein